MRVNRIISSPCPHCGSLKHVVKYDYITWAYFFYAECLFCRARGPLKSSIIDAEVSFCESEKKQTQKIEDNMAEQQNDHCNLVFEINAENKELKKIRKRLIDFQSKLRTCLDRKDAEEKIKLEAGIEALLVDIINSADA